MKKIFIFSLVVMAMLLGSTLVSKAVDTGMPDLQITASNITITPAVLKIGTTAAFKAKVENKGTTSATKVKVRFFINEKQVGEKIISTIVKNSNSSATLSYKIPAGMTGDQVLHVTVGDELVLKEDNNLEGLIEIKDEILKLKNYKIQAEKKITVIVAPPLMPDLSVVATDLKITPASYKGGDKINLRAIIKNLGTEKAANIKVQFFFKGVNVYNKTITSISKKSNKVVTYSYLLPANISGSVPFKAKVDPDNTIIEVNEKNNEAEINANINQAQINLFLETLKVSVSKPKAGQKVNITAKIRNNGNVKISNIKVAFFTNINSPTPTAVKIIANLNSKALSSQSYSWTVPASLFPAVDYPIKAVIDPDNTIAEANELDNIKLTAISLTAPDISLTMGEYWTKSKIVYSKGLVQEHAFLKNNNVEPVKYASVALYYYLGNNSAQPIKISEGGSAISKNGTKEILLTGQIADGLAIGTQVHFIVKVDPNGALSETDKTNNRAETVRTVVEKPKQVQFPYLNISVNDDQGNPLNGAVLTLKNNDTGVSQSKITGQNTYDSFNGGAVFESLPSNASLTVTVTATGFRSQSETFAYRSDNPELLFRAYILDKRAELSGTVKNLAGAVLPGVYVRIDGTGLEAITDAQGKYGFLLNGGTYTLRFSREGYNRAIESNYAVAPLSTQTLNKTMTPGTTAYFSGRVTDDEGNGLGNTDIYVNNTMLGTTAADGHFNLNINAGNKKFTFKKPTFVNTEFTDTIVAGKEYYYDLVMYKPSTANHVERGTNIVSWHQHEGTPANSFFISEYNIDIWWGMGNVKMGMDFNKTDGQTKISKLVINARGDNWECNKVEGEGSIETSAIDIPITIAAGSCSAKKTQMDVYKVAIESGGTEIWSDEGFWSSASDPMNSKSKAFTLANLPVTWDNNLKVKMWVRVQKKAVIGTDGDGAGALYGYHMDKKLITWYPQKPPTTKISTSWKQIGGYFLGILDNPVNAITGFMDIFTVDKFEQYTMEEVLPANFPGAPPAY